MNKYSNLDVRYKFHIKDSDDYNKTILPIPFIHKQNSCDGYNIGILDKNNIDTDIDNLKDTNAGYFYENTRPNINDMNTCDTKYYIDDYKTPLFVDTRKKPEKKKFNKYVYDVIETFSNNYETIKTEFYIIMLCIIIFAFMLV